MQAGTRLGIAALVIALATAALWFRRVAAVEIPEDRTLFVVAFLCAVVLGIAAFVRGSGWLGRIAAVFAILVGSFLPLTVAISRQEVPTETIRVGDLIPPFTATDEHGELFDSRSLQGHLVLIKFFRAHW